MTTAGFLDEQQHQRPGAAIKAGGCSGGTADVVDAYHRQHGQDQQASSNQHNPHPILTPGTNFNDHHHRHHQQHQTNQEHLNMKQVAPNTAPSLANLQYDNIIQQHSHINQDHQQHTNHPGSNQRPNRLYIINQEYNRRDAGKDIDDKFSDEDDVYDNEDDNDNDEDDDDSSEAQLAVASAEEYAAKIIKLQQACLIPLKEDLADWLNKILKISSITTENFMDKLDNGVIICRLAKIISLWCEQQLTETEAEEFTANNVSNNCLIR